jgi:glutamine cyclotransferase
MTNGRFWAALSGAGFAAALALAGTAQAAPFIYANSATSPSAQRLYKIDLATGAVVTTCLMGKGNGRGIVIVGNIAYYTVGDSGDVFKADISTCADLGVAFTVAGASGLSTIAYDGTNFWIGDYSGTNNAFYYSPTGTLLNTVPLANCTGFCDGLEYFNNKLISNRGDASTSGYDIYDTSGSLLTPQFIAPTAYSGTGIAFDGTDFYVSDIFSQKLQKYSGTTGALITTITITGLAADANVIEDLSVDYSQRSDTGGGAAPPSAVPTLSEWVLAALSLAVAAAAGLALRRRRV